MFGMSFGEILIIAVIAILFIGPDKLPEAMVQIAKFFKSFKNTVNETKETIEQELHLAELKEEALNYKETLNSAVNNFKLDADFNIEDDLTNEVKEIEDSLKQIDSKPKEKKSKKPKKKKISGDEDV